jgi:rfaE bifunctional protein nucleotidyltransferase chain/domain
MLPFIQSKIHTKESLQRVLAGWKLLENKIVFTNGCFDILHYGHVQYLAEARALGAKLIVGVNAAESVRRLKGENRPINDDKTRLTLLAALICVDAVIVFEEDTPYELIEFLQPNVLVKGGDWQPESIVGSAIVLKNGGEVRSLRFADGYSTTNIEQKILENASKNN